MRFQAIPPTFEARAFEGTQTSVLDIQGWLLAAGIQSQTFSESEDHTGEITFTDGSGTEKTLHSGEWLFRQAPDKFVPMDPDLLFTTYTQVP